MTAADLCDICGLDLRPDACFGAGGSQITFRGTLWWMRKEERIVDSVDSKRQELTPQEKTS